jgi:hypothetical protein
VSIGKNNRSTEVPATAPAYLAFEGHGEKYDGKSSRRFPTISESVNEGAIVREVVSPPEIEQMVVEFDTSTLPPHTSNQGSRIIISIIILEDE